MANGFEQDEEVALAANGKTMKLANGWKEALSDCLDAAGNVYIPRLIQNWLELEEQHARVSEKRGKVCVLSIDGGGMRGIIAAKVLAHLEGLLQRKSGDPTARIVDFFDLAAGTNVGGILATMIFTGSGGGDAAAPLLTAAEACKFISDNGKEIFSGAATAAAEAAAAATKRRRGSGRWRRLFLCGSSSGAGDCSGGGGDHGDDCSSPKFTTEGLQRSLSKLLTGGGGGDGGSGAATTVGRALTLCDTLKPVLVPCYDLSTAAPFLFSRAGALQSTAWDFRLADVCAAAAATPGLFPPAVVTSLDGTTRCTAVDAGMVMNSPAAAALTHVLHNAAEFPGVRDSGDVLLLSLGTGQFERRCSSDSSSNSSSSSSDAWGRCQWSRPAGDIVHDNVSDMVDHMLALAFATCRDNYLRLQVVCNEGGVAEIDDASDENVRRLGKIADQLLEQRAMEHLGFAGMRALQQTNAERLEWFAEQLVEEHRARTLRSSPTVVLKKRGEQCQ